MYKKIHGTRTLSMSGIFRGAEQPSRLTLLTTPWSSAPKYRDPQDPQSIVLSLRQSVFIAETLQLHVTKLLLQGVSSTA